MFPMIATLQELRDVKAMLAEEAASLGVAADSRRHHGGSAGGRGDGRAVRAGSRLLLHRHQRSHAIHARDGPRASEARAAGRRPESRGAAAHRADGRRRAAAGRRWSASAAASPAIRTAVPILVGLGVDELSVSLPAIPAVKAQIRALRLDDCRALAERALAAESAEEVRALVPDPTRLERTQTAMSDMPLQKRLLAPAENRQVHDAAGLGAARRRHPARRRQRELLVAAREPVAQVMATAGDAIFGNLPLLFAIGVAIGLTENDGVAALAGTVGYVVFLAAMGVCAKLRGIETKPIMGIPSIETGVFGGIIVGLIAAWAFNRFYRDQAAVAISASSRASAPCRSSPRLPSSSSARC